MVPCETNLRQQCQPDEEKNSERQSLALLTPALMGDPFNDSYFRTDIVPNPSSYTAWDGSSPNWDYADETAWGTLYFAP